MMFEIQSGNHIRADRSSAKTAHGFDAGEIELLVRIEVHGFGKYTKLHRLQVFGALRDDHDVCTALAIETLTQPSCRQELVVDDQPVIVD